MKITLSVGGGITGMTKEHSVDLKSLDQETRTELLKYIDKSKVHNAANLNETWSIDDKEAPIDTGKMNQPLKQLYADMKKQLSYSKP